MKSLVCVASIAVLWCALGLAQSSTSATAPENTKQEKSEHARKKTSDCEHPGIKSGYVSDLRFHKSDRKIKVYDSDYPDTDLKHPAICLSRSRDSIFWVSGSGKRFRLRIKARDEKKCGNHPFVIQPTDATVNGYYSGVIRPDVPIGCVYDVEFKSEKGEKADPHIQISGP